MNIQLITALMVHHRPVILLRVLLLRYVTGWTMTVMDSWTRT